MTEDLGGSELPTCGKLCIRIALVFHYHSFSDRQIVLKAVVSILKLLSSLYLDSLPHTPIIMLQEPTFPLFPPPSLGAHLCSQFGASGRTDSRISLDGKATTTSALLPSGETRHALSHFVLQCLDGPATKTHTFQDFADVLVLIGILVWIALSHLEEPFLQFLCQCFRLVRRLPDGAKARERE